MLMNLPGASWYLVYPVNLRQLRQRRRVRGRLGEVTQPLFPRYLFVAPGRPEQSIAPLDSTPGVQKMVRFGALYLPVEAEP